MARVTVYYKQCPDCGQKWATQLSQSQVIRLGREAFICKCKRQWPTGRVEWNHLSHEQRRAYFISSAEIGVLVICTIMPALFGYFIGNGWPSALKAEAWGFVVGAVFVAVLWLIKLSLVGLSLRRCPAVEHSIEMLDPKL
jgi:hypothetical protein